MPSQKYIVIEGDSLWGIAQRFYGDGRKWPVIWRASDFPSDNPADIHPGETAIIPDLPGVTRLEFKPAATTDRDEVTLAVAERLFSGWEGVTIERSIDTCADAFALSAPFDPERPEMQERFRPFRYWDCKLFLGNEKIITGTIEKLEPSLSEADRTITVQGRSITGALVDCSVDIAEFNFQKEPLGEIARRICEHFGIGVVTPDGDTTEFEEVRCEPGKTVFNFLNALAQGKGMLLSSDKDGNLEIKRSNPTGKPVASIVEGEPPFIGGSANYDGTQRFSRYKVLLQDPGYELAGTHVEDMGIPCYRPTIEVGGEADGTDAVVAAKWRRTMALADSVGLSVFISGWRTPGGQLWDKGDLITLKAPSLMVYKASPFVVAGVTFKIDETQGRITDLRLVLPQTYTTEMPGVYPWD